MANILIGISGSIAAYKAVLLVRELDKAGHNCKVILTDGGLKFVTPELLAGLGIEVYHNRLINFSDPNVAMLHINLAKWADLIMIAPASASTLSRIAAGIASDLLGEMLLVANDKPRFIAPAMNYQMWKNSIIQENLSKLSNHGYQICFPDNGSQACGDTGVGRMQEAEQLRIIIEASLKQERWLSNKRIVITLGATVEPIDPIRYISNYSSGKMGAALVKSALNTGAEVIALQAKTSLELEPHQRLTIIKTLNAVNMLEVALIHSKNANALIACAAVSDYRPVSVCEQKIKKHSQKITLEFIKNPDIVANCKSKYPHLFCVGFAAETESVIENALNKLKNKNLDLIIANDVAEGKVFAKETAQITIIDKLARIEHLPTLGKQEAAEKIIAKIGQYLCDR